MHSSDIDKPLKTIIIKKQTKSQETCFETK